MSIARASSPSTRLASARIDFSCGCSTSTAACRVWVPAEPRTRSHGVGQFVDLHHEVGGLLLQPVQPALDAFDAVGGLVGRERHGQRLAAVGVEVCS
ncbi:MAG: hypothetical protein WAM92_05320, partial [Mycobacterium sp.]